MPDEFVYSDFHLHDRQQVTTSLVAKCRETLHNIVRNGWLNEYEHEEDLITMRIQILDIVGVDYVSAMLNEYGMCIESELLTAYRIMK